MTPCRRCEKQPKIVSEEIVPDEISHAIYCPHGCYNDTHWQSSMMKALELWERNPCPADILGGQGDPTDDRRFKTQ